MAEPPRIRTLKISAPKSTRAAVELVLLAPRVLKVQPARPALRVLPDQREPLALRALQDPQAQPDQLVPQEPRATPAIQEAPDLPEQSDPKVQRERRATTDPQDHRDRSATPERRASRATPEPQALREYRVSRELRDLRDLLVPPHRRSMPRSPTARRRWLLEPTPASRSRRPSAQPSPRLYLLPDRIEP